VSDVDAIVDAVCRAGELVILADNIAKKKNQIRQVSSKKCGNCGHWMKTTCKPEKERGEFKSSGSMVCHDFVMCHSKHELKIRFEQELELLRESVEGANQ